MLFVCLIVCSVVGSLGASNKGKKEKKREKKEKRFPQLLVPSLEFSIRPSIDDKVSVSTDGVTCSFSWTDCTGGSSEAWSIEVKKVNGKAECLIGRPRDSYLTFSEWEARLEGAPSVQVMVVDGTGSEMLQDADYLVEAVSSGTVVKNGHKGRHTMQGIQMFED